MSAPLPELGFDSERTQEEEDDPLYLAGLLLVLSRHQSQAPVCGTGSQSKCQQTMMSPANKWVMSISLSLKGYTGLEIQVKNGTASIGLLWLFSKSIF